MVEAGPNIFNHNTETVPRLYSRIRPKAVYANSLALLRHVKALAPEMVTKSGVMVGLGETEDELVEVFRNMRAHDIDVLTTCCSGPSGLGASPPTDHVRRKLAALNALWG